MPALAIFIPSELLSTLGDEAHVIGGLRTKRIRVGNALSRSGLPDLDYSLNPYVGCYHACIYCYAPGYVRYREVAQNWGEVIYVKENLIQVLSREVRRKKPGRVGISTISEPYQPLEAKERLTRRSIEILLSNRFHPSIQTKSDLILEDLDLFAESKEKLDVGFTITTLDDELSELMEPRAPTPRRRVRALERLSENHVRTWIFLGPIIPGINDDGDSMKDIVELAAETSSFLYFDPLRLKPWVIPRLRRELEERGFDAEVVMERTRDKRWLKRLRDEIYSNCKRLGVECESET